MDNITVKITGADELARKLESEPPVVARQIVRTSLRKAMAPMRTEIIGRVRRGWHVFQHARLRGKKGQGSVSAGREREFGVIANNILMRSQTNGDFQGSVAVYPSKRAYWAKFLEFGTRKMQAFTFMRPAFETKKQEVLDDFIEDVREQLRDTLDLK
jgi:HK97 gp10 family phage protein